MKRFQNFKLWFSSLSSIKKGGILVAFFAIVQIFCCFPIYALGSPSSEDIDATVVARLTELSITTVPTITEVPAVTATITNTPRPTFTDAPTATTTFTSTPNAIVSNYPCITDPSPQTGTVLEVVDGDTIKVLIDGTTYSLRYIGMDTPESTIQHEVFGKEASAKNAELVYGKKVTLYRDHSETDKFDRLLRYVFVDDLFVNAELVRLGYAEAKDYPPDTACSQTFHQLNNAATAAKLGMWSSVPATPIPSAPLIAVPLPSGGSSGSVSISIVTVNKSAEYVIIHNDGSTAVDLTGWRLLSEKGPQDCALGGIIEAGADLTIFAMTGDGGYNCGFGSNIWNNSSPDPAVLYDPQGNEIDRK